MSPEMADIAIPMFLKCIRERLEEATSIAKAAEACAEAGNPEKGVEVVIERHENGIAYVKRWDEFTS